jgi:hypothetical protein
VRVRRRRLVRAHLVGMTESVEGILTGRTRDFYILAAAKVVNETGDTHTLTGSGESLIPRDRVLFLQTL